MYLQFIYSSTPLGAPDQIEAVLSRFRSLCIECELEEDFSPMDVRADGSIEIKSTLHFGADDSEFDPSQSKLQIFRVLSSLASEFGHSWNVGHHLEPQFGTISAGIAPQELQELMEEVRTAIHVARSMTGLIVDDEFIEPESSVEPSGDNIADEGSWSDLLESNESFIRFPELE